MICISGPRVTSMSGRSPSMFTSHNAWSVSAAHRSHLCQGGLHRCFHLTMHGLYQQPTGHIYVRAVSIDVYISQCMVCISGPRVTSMSGRSPSMFTSHNAWSVSAAHGSHLCKGGLHQCLHLTMHGLYQRPTGHIYVRVVSINVYISQCMVCISGPRVTSMSGWSPSMFTSHNAWSVSAAHGSHLCTGGLHQCLHLTMHGLYQRPTGHIYVRVVSINVSISQCMVLSAAHGSHLCIGGLHQCFHLTMHGLISGPWVTSMSGWSPSMFTSHNAWSVSAAHRSHLWMDGLYQCLYLTMHGLYQRPTGHIYVRVVSINVYSNISVKLITSVFLWSASEIPSNYVWSVSAAHW